MSLSTDRKTPGGGAAKWRGRQFVVERPVLRARATELGVIGEVELHLVRYSNDRGTVARLIPLESGRWRIALETTLSAKEASETIYHELAHVLQAQQRGGFGQLQQELDAQADALFAQPRRPWSRKPFMGECQLEREADEACRAWHKEKPLAVKWTSQERRRK